MKSRGVWPSKINIEKIFIIIGLSLILFTPMISAASISLVASKDKYHPGDTLVVLGTSTPDSAVAIQVYNPKGGLVGINQVETRNDGQYVIEVFKWPDKNSSNIPFGIFVVKAVDAASGESTKINITFAESTITPPIPPIIEIQNEPVFFQIIVSTSSTYQLGDEIRGVILFNFNGSQIEPTETKGIIYSSEIEGFSSEIINLIHINGGMYYFDFQPDKIGTFFVYVEGSINATNNIGISSFQVTERLATKSNLNEVQDIIVNRIDQAQSDIIENFNNELSIFQSNLIEQINYIQNVIENSSLSSRNDIEKTISLTANDLSDQIKSNVKSTEESLLATIEVAQNQVDSMKNNLDSVNIGVSNASVWITIVGLIALITLVLELMMFVRKIS